MLRPRPGALLSLLLPAISLTLLGGGAGAAPTAAPLGLTPAPHALRTAVGTWSPPALAWSYTGPRSPRTDYALEVLTKAPGAGGAGDDRRGGGRAAAPGALGGDTGPVGQRALAASGAGGTPRLRPSCSTAAWRTRPTSPSPEARVASSTAPTRWGNTALPRPGRRADRSATGGTLRLARVPYPGLDRRAARSEEPGDLGPTGLVRPLAPQCRLLRAVRRPGTGRRPAGSDGVAARMLPPRHRALRPDQQLAHGAVAEA